MHDGSMKIEVRLDIFSPIAIAIAMEISESFCLEMS